MKTKIIIIVLFIVGLGISTTFAGNNLSNEKQGKTLDKVGLSLYKKIDLFKIYKANVNFERIINYKGAVACRATWTKGNWIVSVTADTCPGALTKLKAVLIATNRLYQHADGVIDYTPDDEYVGN